MFKGHRNYNLILFLLSNVLFEIVNGITLSEIKDGDYNEANIKFQIKINESYTNKALIPSSDDFNLIKMAEKLNQELMKTDILLVSLEKNNDSIQLVLNYKQIKNQLNINTTFEELIKEIYGKDLIYLSIVNVTVEFIPKLKPWMIAVIVVAIVVFITAIALLIFFLCRSRVFKKKSTDNYQNNIGLNIPGDEQTIIVPNVEEIYEDVKPNTDGNGKPNEKDNIEEIYEDVKPNTDGNGKPNKKDNVEEIYEDVKPNTDGNGKPNKKDNVEEIYEDVNPNNMPNPSDLNKKMMDEMKSKVGTLNQGIKGQSKFRTVNQGNKISEVKNDYEDEDEIYDETPAISMQPTNATVKFVQKEEEEEEEDIYSVKI